MPGARVLRFDLPETAYDANCCLALSLPDRTGPLPMGRAVLILAAPRGALSVSSV